jgi:hypothetical protein
MTKNMPMCVTAIVSIALMSFLGQLTAQQSQYELVDTAHANSAKHPTYKLVDLGTFGGRASRNWNMWWP